MKTLVHGTTLHRAQRIIQLGPDARFHEPGGHPCNDGFSTFLESGPFFFGTHIEYACLKAKNFPNEGGAAILAMDVPDEIIALTDSVWFPLSQGLIQFDTDAGMPELIAAWPALQKRIIIPECP